MPSPFLFKLDKEASIFHENIGLDLGICLLA